MKTVNIFLTIIITLLVAILMSSCSKEDITNVSDKETIVLTAPAFPQIGDDATSRTSYTDDGTKMLTAWRADKTKPDKIYVGSIPTDIASGTTLSQLVEDGNFAVFTCASVDENGKATFEGESIPEGANMAIYGNADMLNMSVDGRLSYSLENYQLKGNYSTTLAETDLLLATFDGSTNTLSEFLRGLALFKIEVDNWPSDINMGGGTIQFTILGATTTSKAKFCNVTYIDNNANLKLGASSDYKTNTKRYFTGNILADGFGKLTVYTFVTPSGNFNQVNKLEVKFTPKDGTSILFTKDLSSKSIVRNYAINLKFDYSSISGTASAQDPIEE